MCAARRCSGCVFLCVGVKTLQRSGFNYQVVFYPGFFDYGIECVCAREVKRTLLIMLFIGVGVIKVSAGLMYNLLVSFKLSMQF